MACQRYYELISRRLDGDLTQGEERELEAHLKECSGCLALAEQLSGLHEDFSALEEVPAPDGFARGVMDRIRAEEENKGKVIPLFRRPQFKAVAGLAACLVLCAGLYGAGQLDLAGEHIAPVSDNTASSNMPQTAAALPRESDGSTADETEEGEPGISEYAVLPEETGDDAPQITAVPRTYGSDWYAQEKELPQTEQPQAQSIPENTQNSGGSLQSDPEPVTGVGDNMPEDQEDTPGVGTACVGTVQSAFSNEQYLPVTCGATPKAPSAVILGSVESLADYLAAFPQDDLSALAATYGEEYFASGRLLAVVAETDSGSNTLELAEDGLSQEQVVLTEKRPEEATDDMAAWLILAQVGMEFEDGAELEVSVVRG